MKKMLMLLGAVACAAVAQAATFNWSVAAGTAYDGYSVYLTKGSKYATLAALQDDLIGASGNSGTLAKATASARNVSAATFVSGLTANTSYDFYFVFVKDDNYWVSGKQVAVIGAESDTPPTLKIAQAAGTSLLGGTPTGKFSSVPEPTSGLLLLLGMAGLALKRKVA